MANIKSAKKRAKQSEVKRQRNLARKSAVKTAVKKVLTSIAKGEKKEVTQQLLKDAEAKLARAKGKGLIHANAAARKVSRLAKKVAVATR